MRQLVAARLSNRDAPRRRDQTVGMSVLFTHANNVHQSRNVTRSLFDTVLTRWRRHQGRYRAEGPRDGWQREDPPIRPGTARARKSLAAAYPNTREFNRPPCNATRARARAPPRQRYAFYTRRAAITWPMSVSCTLDVYADVYRLDEEGKGRRRDDQGVEEEREAHTRAPGSSNCSAHRAARTGIMIHNEARASPRSPVHRFWKSPRWRYSRPRPWRAWGAFVIGALYCSPPIAREIRNSDWRRGGHYGTRMGVAGQQTTPMYTRTPSRWPTTRRCSVYLGKSVRSSRVLGPTDIVQGYTRRRLNRHQRVIRVAELRLLFFSTCLIHWLNRTIRLTVTGGERRVTFQLLSTFRLLRVEFIRGYSSKKLTILDTSIKDLFLVSGYLSFQKICSLFSIYFHINILYFYTVFWKIRNQIFQETSKKFFFLKKSIKLFLFFWFGNFKKMFFFPKKIINVFKFLVSWNSISFLFIACKMWTLAPIHYN